MTISFEKPSAAKTALMLNGGTLDGAHLNVTSDTVHPDEPDTHGEHQAETAAHHDSHGIDQTDKPKAGSMSSIFNSIIFDLII